MFLANKILEANYSLEKRKSEKGPDLLLNFANRNIWIEIITPGSGNELICRGIDVADISLTGKAQSFNLDKTYVRILNALNDKRRKFAEYIEDRIIGKNDICIIAINTIFLAPDSPGKPDVEVVLYDTNDGWAIDEKGHCGCVCNRTVAKSNGTIIWMGCFRETCLDNYSFISGVLFTRARLAQDSSMTNIYFARNFFTSRKMPLGLFKEWDIQSGHAT